jgi:hypothetical protein
MHDISQLRRIAEDADICLDPNNVISIGLWVTWLHQAGAGAILKDKLDPPPPGSGLSSDVFVLCIQTQSRKKNSKNLDHIFYQLMPPTIQPSMLGCSCSL